MKRIAGFTLIEVLVSLAILALISIAAHTIFGDIEKKKELTDQQLDEIASFTTVFRLMEQDFSQLAQRNTRNESGDSLDMFLAADRFLFESQYHGIAVVRDGWNNPASLLARSELQLVSYIVEDDALVRQYRVYVDSLDGEQARKQVLLANVGDFKIEFRGKGDKWEESWNEKSLPRALKITLQLIDETQVSRIFLLPQVVS